MAEWQQHFLNYVGAPLSYITLLLLIPPYILIKIIFSIKRSIFIENVAGKVVLITGASSGIGEHIAYAYARKGARLVLAARRKELLRKVADRARSLGSPDVLLVATDVAKIEHCERMVNETIKHFGQLDHLVNNAGIVDGGRVEDITDISRCVSVMDVNYWGSVYSTRAAIPHLRKSKGKIIVIASCGVWFSFAKMSFYNASKAAMITFFETLRTEIGSDIGITIVTPGIIDSEMTQGDRLEQANMHVFPVASTEKTTKAIVNSACRGDRYLVEPSWVGAGHFYHALFPEAMQGFNHFVTTNFPSKKFD